MWAEIDKAVTEKAPAAAAVHAEACRLRVEARRQLPVQRAVLLDGRRSPGCSSADRERPRRGRRPTTVPHRPAASDVAAQAVAPGPRRCASSARDRAAMVALLRFPARSSRSACWRRSMPHWSPTPIRSARTSSGKIIVDGETVPVMEQSTEGLGLGFTPIGPTWDSAPISSAPTTRAATWRRGCSMAAATRC